MVLIHFQDDELENTYEEPDEKHEYCTPSAAPRPSLLDEDTEHYQTPRPTPSCEMSNYDNPRGTLETHPGGEKTTSTDLTFRTQFESALTQQPVNVPSRDALASGPEDDGDLLISFDSPAGTGTVTQGIVYVTAAEEVKIFISWPISLKVSKNKLLQSFFPG